MERGLIYFLLFAGHAITCSYCFIASHDTKRPTFDRCIVSAMMSLQEDKSKTIEYESNRLYKGGVDGVETLKEMSRALQLSQSYSMQLLPHFESPQVFLDNNFSPLDSINFLRENCGMKRSRIHEMIKRHPELSARLLMRVHASNPRLKSTANIIYDMLGDDCQMTKDSSVMRTASRSDVRSKLRFFSTHPSIGLSSSELNKLLLKHPELFSYNLKNMKDVIHFFQNDAQMSPEELQRVINKSPVVLSYSVEHNLKPTVLYFQGDNIRFRLQEIRSMIGVYPPFLYYSDKSQLEKVRQFLEDIFDDSNDILRVSMSEPIVWGLPIDELKARVIYLVESMELDLEELQLILTSFPKLFTLQVETNLKPTIEFFLNQTTKGDLRDYVMECPSVLACSLESRIQPRDDVLRGIGFDSVCDTPAYIMLLSDPRFRDWIDKSLNL